MRRMALHDRNREALPIDALSSTKRVQAEIYMLDVVVLALGLGLFVAAVGYTYGCERL
jgi:hypothetical protein